MYQFILSFIIFICSSSIVNSMEITPDTNESHCKAFKGTWTDDGKCKNRLEYQQRPIGITASKQWCEARGGTLKHTRRGPRCSGAKSSQGVAFYPSADAHNFRVHKDVMSSCVQRYKANERTCNVRATSEKGFGYNYTEGSTLAGSGFMAFAAGMIRAANKVNYNFDGAKERDYLVTSIKGYMAANPLNSCQQACLVKCAASKVLSYSSDHDTKLRGYEDIYDKRLGECTEFSSIASQLGTRLGVPVRVASGPGHAYNYFKIDGRWYLGEPQSSSCDFYHSNATKEDYQTVYAVEGELVDGARRAILPFRTRSRVNQGDRSSGASSLSK